MNVRQQFQPDGIYLDTPTYGLASDAVVETLQSGLERWRKGLATMDEYDEAVDRSRRLMAEIAGVDPAHVAVANQVSVLAGVVAASLRDGATVVAPEGEFASLLFPILVHEDRGVTVETVPLEDLHVAVDSHTDLVAFSLVQSSDGSVADIEAIEEAARRHDARLLVDATQAAGWLPFDAGRFDYTVASAYKWLLCPRGTAFMALGPRHDPTIRPLLAGWYAGENVWDSIYGTPLRLASSARRFDVSPAWLSWLGSVPALQLIADQGVEAIYRHDVDLANTARDKLSLPASESAIVTIPLSDTASLADRGISASVRAASVRVGFHLYNDVSDVEALVEAVTAAGQS